MPKKAILKRTGRSDEDMIRELFNNVTRDDQTPSRLLYFMKNCLEKHSSVTNSPGPVVGWLFSTVTQILDPMIGNTPLN